jgi:hypothetical protein
MDTNLNMQTKPNIWASLYNRILNGIYACSLTVVELMLMFLRRNPSDLLAFVVMLFIWLSHLRSDCIVTPRYLALSACSSWCPCRVYELKLKRYSVGLLGILLTAIITPLENITQLEQVQCRAARYITNRYHNTSRKRNST